ncbi:LytR/AlgR family response regulator transcription factor [Floccifex sp.]|uniref:LytR/AlgR family response regulator transcription factor n=1 Tax=Floccifex sp. TaxID=2815810 RepID=UPI0029FF3C62|nr:LytTR family transcriptional regulator DNA-binding domain-containing protein [Floccifex sp.]MDD7280420.1 LytTR family DNA-binding domain-containing protein [Erysipelotrichaceae bacterium]MDY2957578.1 LytTR family DNA-binding domain-containing protein [Floccifex sp.]
MIKIAFLEYENEIKELSYLMAKTFHEQDWTFRIYSKASDLMKGMKNESYQIFVFDEIFKTPRIESVFVHDNPNAVFVFVVENKYKYIKEDKRGRILYIEKNHIQEQYENIQNSLLKQSKQSDIYHLNYDRVNVNLPYEEIYYLEKDDKMVYFYTKKGKFHQRINIGEMEEIFVPYGFIRIHVSYLVNEKYILAWYKDKVELTTGEVLPLSRLQKQKILASKNKSI